MCEYFVKADPIQYEQRTRTIRIHGVLTSIRLENMVWDILAEMAEAARRLGADAVVGVDLDYEVLGSGNSMLMVTASGTAVKLAP